MLEQPAFGRHIKTLRMERGLSQTALAGDVMSTGYLSRIESGSRPPTERIVAYLAQRLGVSPTVFETPPVRSLARVLAAVTSAAGPLSPGPTSPDMADVVAGALRDADDRWDPALRWQALWFLARLRETGDRHGDEDALVAELVTLADELGVAELRVRARTQLARQARGVGDYAAAREHAAAAHALSDGLALPDRAAALQELVSAEAEVGRLAEARAHADELCAGTRHAGGSLHVRALWAAATVRIRQADYRGAHDMLERAVALAEGRDDPLLWVRVRLAAVSLDLQLDPPATGRAREGLDLLAHAVELLGSDLQRQQLVVVRAHLAFEEGQFDHARELCAQVDDRPMLLSFRDRVRFQALRRRLQVLDGHTDEGIRGLQELAGEAQDAMNPELAAEIWQSLARSLAAAGHQRAR